MKSQGGEPCDIIKKICINSSLSVVIFEGESRATLKKARITKIKLKEKKTLTKSIDESFGMESLTE